MEPHAVYTVDRHIIILRHALLLYLLPSPAASQPHQVPENPTGGESPSMGAITVVIIAAIFLLGLFSLYIRHLTGDSSITDRRFSAYARRPCRGLDPAVIESFPVFDYSAVKTLKIGKGALECAVCLNEFEDDDTLRLIPKCDHVFHPECIDSWLASHTTCPVCRAELPPNPDMSTHGSQTGEVHPLPQNDDVAGQPVAGEGESLEQPPNAGCLPPKLNRNRTRRSVSGGRRWYDRYTRSNSTGHVAVKQWENVDRFTLRLPEEIRKQIISGKLSRTVSCVVLPRDWSSRVGNRAGFGGPYGEGINRNSGRSDRSGFSLALPFFTRAPKVVSGSGGKTSGVAAETKLPPV